MAMVALGVSLGQVLSMGFPASLRGLTNGGSDHGQDHGDYGENQREFHFYKVFRTVLSCKLNCDFEG